MGMSGTGNRIVTSRRVVLGGLGLATLLHPGLQNVARAREAARDRYLFDTDLFPAYRVQADLDRAARTLRANVDIEVPSALVRDGVVVVALTEDASDLAIFANGAPIKATRRDDAAVPASLRRWTLPIGGVDGSVPARLNFTYRITDAASTLFAITSDGAVGSGTGTAWYPQIARADGVRLEGVGELKISSGPDAIIAGGRSADGRFYVDEPRYFDFCTAPFRIIDSERGRARLYLLRDHQHPEVFAERLETLIRVLERHFGTLPQDRFDLAEAPPLVARAAGFDGASLDGFMLPIGSYFDQPFNTALFGHEVSHQWWGGLVRRVGLNGIYVLDESLAQYGSLLAVEDIEGPAAAEAYRRRGFPGYYAEYSGFTYLARSLAGIDSPITSLPLSDGFISRRVVNSKGMIVWSMLADLVRPRLSRFFRDFIRAHAYRRTSLDALILGLRKLLGENDKFIHDWFERDGAPELSVEWAQSGRRVECIVRQSEPARMMRLPLEIRYRDEKPSRHEVIVERAETRFRIRAHGAVAEVVPDPEYRTLKWTPRYRREAETMLPYTRADIALNYGRNDEASGLFGEALNEIPPEDTYGLRALVLRGLGDIAMAEEKYAEAVGRYREALELSVDGQYQTPELWRSLADAYRFLGQHEPAREANANGVLAIERLLESAPPRD